jgi:chromosome segregation ATPase
MDNKAPVLTDEQVFNISFATPYKSMSIELGVYNDGVAAGAKEQLERCHEYYSKLIEVMNTECEARLKEQQLIHKMMLNEKDKRFAELRESYGRMFQDCSEMEVKIQVLEASLADVKNQVEQARKETTQDMFNWLEESEVTTQVDNYRKFTMWVEDYNDIKSKYGIK